MQNAAVHSFHIPVMGIGFTIDTPLKIARFGISSVVSIIEDELLDLMRKTYCEKENRTFIAISAEEQDYRARRITAFLDLTSDLIHAQMDKIRAEPFESGKDILKYFELLADNSPLKRDYVEMTTTESPEKEVLQHKLRQRMMAGAIEVNIMTKLDKTNYSPQGEELPAAYCDAMSALRGFARSSMEGAIVFSAGLNPRLYSYCATFDDFYPDKSGKFRKRIVLKVSDYRSALIQGKFLAKKGLWVAEFRIESGLNCGGHAFVSDGMLLGPILEEFKIKREELRKELIQICNEALVSSGKPTIPEETKVRITAQGGVGTAAEHTFLRAYYGLDSIGWGSPFLLVPEATSVDGKTLEQLAGARPEDYFLSDASPLGVPFNNFRPSSSEAQRKSRIAKNRPGSPCYKEYLTFDTEFTERPVCVASRQYQHLKIEQIKAKKMAADIESVHIEAVVAKDCLCEGLTASALQVHHIPPSHKLTAVTICPGPNLAYFSGVFTLAQMVDHIYGRNNHLNKLPRPHMFMNELVLNLNYFKEAYRQHKANLKDFRPGYFTKVQANLRQSMQYYQTLIPQLKEYSATLSRQFAADLEGFNLQLTEME